MPAENVHFIFADTILEKEIPFRKAAILGSQGSDPFFYYGYSFSKRENKKEIRNIASFIHHMDLSILLNFFIDYAKKQKDPILLLSYIKGFFLHYILDRNAHPYIWYRSGFKTNETKINYSWLHGYFESNLDSIFKEKMGYKKHSTKNGTKIDKNQLLEISKMYYAANEKIIQNKYMNEHTFYEAVKDMTTASATLNSKSGIKKKIIQVIMPFSIVNAIAVPRTVKDDNKVDYLNLKKRVWKNPETGIESNKSFIEIVNKAKKEAILVDKLIDSNNLANLDSFVNKINHDGISLTGEMKYQNCFYNLNKLPKKWLN